MALADRVPEHSDDFTQYAHDYTLTDDVLWNGSSLWASPVIYSVGEAIGLIPPDRTQDYAAGSYISFIDDQYITFQVANTASSAARGGAGVLLRVGFDASDHWYYQVMVCATTDTVSIFKTDLRDGTSSTLGSTSFNVTVGDFFTFEAVSDGSGGCDITVFDGSDDSEIITRHESVELLGDSALILSPSDDETLSVGLYIVEMGHLDSAATRSFDSVNPGDVVSSNGAITVTGSGLSLVSGATISEAGARPYSLTLMVAAPGYVTFEPVDIHETQLEYGTLTMTLAHPDTPPVLERTFTMYPADGWQAVTLAGSNTQDYMEGDTIVPYVDGDVLEIPTTVGLSTLELFADADVTYDPAVPQLTVHTRWLFDQTSNDWDDGTVTINQTQAVVPIPPVYQPKVCFYGVYFEHDFSTGWTNADPAGFGAIDLPAGLNINSAGLCTGIPTAP
jgi:hypothetical protein